jgi:ADP-dependent NAD(P)H-hydrate dehydratase / NAD(P)H-hydrate epimerase
MKIVTAAQMQNLDRRTIMEAGIPGTTLMGVAGARVVESAELTYGSFKNKRVTILCGKGNNGGDGFVIGRLLRKQHADIVIFLIAGIKDLSGDARGMYRRFVGSARSSSVIANPSNDRLRARLRSSDLVVDALLGTGLASPVSGAYAAAIDALNEMSSDHVFPVVAVDLPSGIHADTGEALGTAVRATLTVTLGLPKLGLYVNQGIDHAGRIAVADIGIPRAYVDAVESRLSLITASYVRHLIPGRPPSAHKGTYGHAAIIAGAVGKSGAAAMAAKAALRVGTGLVTVATPSSANRMLEAKLLEAMTAPMPETDAGTLAFAGLERLVALVHDRTAAAVGPGLTTHPDTARLVQELVQRIDRPCVIDADALNAVSARPDILTASKVPLILTPHPGEMARLERSTSAVVNANRVSTAVRVAEGHRVIVVLKGARTIVARPDGFAAICPTGNPGMATAGTGDVLTGMIVGLLAQRLSPWDAACAATYLHGAAGDLAAGEIGQIGMTAGDVIERIPHAIRATIAA